MCSCATPVTTPHALKGRRLLRACTLSYADTRDVANARGGSHHPDYWAETQILASDVARAHGVPMPSPPAFFVGAGEDVSVWTPLASMVAHGARPAGVAFLLQGNVHAHSLRLVGELVPNRTKGPLMQFLICGGANI